MDFAIGLLVNFLKHVGHGHELTAQGRFDHGSNVDVLKYDELPTPASIGMELGVVADSMSQAIDDKRCERQPLSSLIKVSSYDLTSAGYVYFGQPVDDMFSTGQPACIQGKSALPGDRYGLVFFVFHRFYDLRSARLKIRYTEMWHTEMHQTVRTSRIRNADRKSMITKAGFPVLSSLDW